MGFLSRLFQRSPKLDPELEKELKLRRLEVKEGSIEIDMTPSQRVAANLVAAFRDQLKDAKNYVEMTLYHRDDGKYVVTITRPRGKSPHQQLQEALAKISELEAEVSRLSSKSEPTPSPNPSSS